METKKEEYLKQLTGFFGLAYGCFWCALINIRLFSIGVGILSTLVSFYCYFKLQEVKYGKEKRS